MLFSFSDFFFLLGDGRGGGVKRIARVREGGRVGRVEGKGKDCGEMFVGIEYLSCVVCVCFLLDIDYIRETFKIT